MEDYLEFAKALALQAGDVMLEHFQIGISATRKENKTPVTIADEKINAIVIREVKKHFPDHSVLGEEASHANKASNYVWVCDPIDGTTPYTFGLAINVFSLVLTREGIPEIGVVYDPYLKRLFTAQKGKGAFLGDQKLHVNNLKMKDAVIGCSSKTSKIVDAPQLHADVERSAHRTMALYCAIYEGMMVTAGQMAGHIFVGAGAYDAVASALFVTEAGGKVTNLFGEEQRYDEPVKGAVATNGIVHEEILALVQKNLLQI